MSDFSPGARVRLVVPENPRLHGAAGVIEAVTDWGAHVLTPAAATGRFRALASEMTSEAPAPREQGYTGDVCDRCGGCRMVRSGACLVCLDCGSAGGCG